MAGWLVGWLDGTLGYIPGTPKIQDLSCPELLTILLQARKSPPQSSQ